MNNHTSGRIEFYHEEEVNTTDRKSFQRDPLEIINNESRRILKIDRKMVYIVLSDNFIYMPTLQVVALYRKMLKRQVFIEQVQEVSRVFYSNHENSTRDIVRITGYKESVVKKILGEYLLKQSEVFP